jgi:DNA primase
VTVAENRRPGAVLDATAPQQDNLAELYTALAGEVHKLVTSDGWRAWLQTAARFHQYSFLNTVLIHAQRPDATQVAGYRVWQSLGRQVNKGQRGIRILAPIVRRTELSQEQVAAMPPGDPVPSAPPRRVVGYRPTYVWDVVQTSGKPLAAPPQSAAAVTGLAPPGLWGALAAEVASAGFRLRDQTLPGGMDGQTDFRARVVTIDPGADDAHRVVTLAHELAHIALHNPFAGATDATPTYQLATGHCRGDQEVEAESVAYLVATVHGIDTADYSFDYLARWASSKGDDVVGVTQRVGARVVRTAHEILDRIGTVGAVHDGDHRARELHVLSAETNSIDGLPAHAGQPPRALGPRAFNPQAWMHAGRWGTGACEPIRAMQRQVASSRTAAGSQ